MPDTRYDMARDMRTPLARVRGLGASGGGTEHFWHHRLTALANIPLALAFIAIAANLVDKSHGEALALLGKPWIALILALFAISITTHMRMGLQIVIEDYVPGKGARLAALIANSTFSILVAAVCLFSLLKIALL
jgi:succinate dehydrogenase / fumarate reductase, membrane anchor subunit